MTDAPPHDLRRWLWVNFGWDIYEWADEDLRF